MATKSAPARQVTPHPKAKATTTKPRPHGTRTLASKKVNEAAEAVVAKRAPRKAAASKASAAVIEIADGKVTFVTRTKQLSEMLAVEAESSTLTAEQVGAMDQVERLNVYKVEKAALLAWFKSGAIPPRPATPVLDWFEMGAQRPVKATKASKAKNPRTPKGTVVWRRQGADIDRKRFTLGFMAYESTKGILSPESKRMTTAEFRTLLAGLGVTAPESSTWEVTLPNGISVGARLA